MTTFLGLLQLFLPGVDEFFTDFVLCSMIVVILLDEVRHLFFGAFHNRVQTVFNIFYVDVLR